MAKKNRSVRYAVVALGHIAQKAILPAFAHAGNSVLTALVSDSPFKLKKLAAEYDVELTYNYSQFEDCLRSGFIDAVFIALPNDLHKPYAIQAAKAGIHVLCEKPLAVTARDCQAIIDAASANNVKLMTAYRLHNEETNLKAFEIAQSGKLGDLRYFNSAFSFQVTDKNNIRLRKIRGGGPLYDIGVYCVNAARSLFRAEPTEVFASSANNGEDRFKEVDEMTSAILKFPGERLASFTVGFGSADRGYYEIVGTKGSLRLEPAYEYQGELGQTLKIGDKETEKTFAARDQFASEIIYFSNCILNDDEPEPSGFEGLADVRIIEAILKSARAGRVVKLAPFEKKTWPSMKQEIKRPPVKNPLIIKAQPADGN